MCPLLSAHDQVQIKFDDTSGIFKQQDAYEIENLCPNITFYQQQEVKKPSVSEALLNQDKMRVLEVMKRQLHLRLYRAKKEYEAVTFGILVQGKLIENTVLYMLLSILVLQRYKSHITENANRS